MLILLGAIVVLLLAIVAIFYFRGTGTPASAVDNTGTQAPADTDTSGMPPMAPPAEFDPATATKVPEGETPEDYVTAYFDAVVAGDFAAAYDRLPADKKATSTEEQFASQLEGYSITEYTIEEVTESGDEVEVLANATTSAGGFQYLWTFVAEGDGWLVKSRTLPGMGGM
jgi:hypothetical protein